MRKVWIVCVLCLLVALATVRPWPLTRLAWLEARTRSIPLWHTDYLQPRDNDKYWEARELEHVITRLLRVPVQYGTPSMIGAVGVTTIMVPGVGPGTGIVIDDSLPWTAKLEVMAHEAGHLFMPPTFESQSSESEVFAEAVSYLVCLEKGHDSLSVAAKYLARHKQALHVLRDYRTDIEFAAMVLTP